MATHLQQLLRSLCQNNEWSYAVFWKLKHRARMVLTWEDAYYNNHSEHDPSESKSFGDAPEILHDGHFAHDPLGLAVAKMSYHVYSLGEGIVGQVAVTGKHRWIFAGDRHLMNSCPSPELCDGWQAQFSAGIKTIVVAAVVPHGVVQLGSLSKVDEDPKLLTHIRDIFSTLQDPSACHIQNLMRYNMQSASLLKQSDDSYGTSLPGIHLSEAMESMGKIALPEAIDNVKLIQSISLNQQSTDVFGDAKCRSNNYRIQNADSFESGACNTVVFDGDTHSAEGKLSKLVSSDALERQTFEVNADMQPKFNCVEALENVNPSMFSAGSELYEALGPAFLKQCYTSSWNIEKSEDRSTSHIPEIMESSMLTSDSGSDHLLEAVVASFCHNDANVKKTVSFSTSESMLTSEKMPEPSINTSHTIGSSCYSISCSSLLEESTQNCLNSSDSCSIRSSTSACRDPLARPIEPGKPNKKRARPGENSRPRPRDRQLIQDRIKELRELVPNGSKCSIDSLLERTIKHMVFLQSVTKHADKLSNCSKSRGCGNETGVLGSGYEQGSSWAVEVGGHMKICPIVVENLNMNGQMLIEMLCEECDHFLEIAEAIRSLGLTILKGATDNHGDKTWMRFVVEGQNNRNLHRMDVLWSLVQILQSKTTV